MSISAIRSFLSYFEPAVRRPDYVQAAALCLRDGADGPEVLMVTSLRTRRWILPKGWPMKGRSLAEAAAQEAWEEAGVRGRVDPAEIGAFTYMKMRKTGTPVPCRCSLFRVHVDELAPDWPERKRRARRWMPVAEAADLVAEQELRAVLAGMSTGQ